MDPKATLRMIIDATRDKGERHEACENYRAWIERGGWSPIVITRSGLVVDVTGARWEDGRWVLSGLTHEGDCVDVDAADVSDID